MATVLDVAQRIYDQLGWIDAWKLQKITYYANSWSLAWDGDALFDDAMQAWADGPVSPELYRVNRYARKHQLAPELPNADVNNLTLRQQGVIDVVAAYYGGKSREELIQATHAELPWITARGSLSPGAQCSTPLDAGVTRRAFTLMDQMGGDIPCPPGSNLSGNVEIDDEMVARHIDTWRGALISLQLR